MSGRRGRVLVTAGTVGVCQPEDEDGVTSIGGAFDNGMAAGPRRG